MYPILFEILGRQISAYGLFIILGTIAAFGLTSALCCSSLVRGQLLNRTDTMLTCGIVIAGAIVGAVSLRPIMKIPEVIIQWSYFKQLSIGGILDYVFGEIVFYGGLIGGATAAITFCKLYKIPILPTLDAIAPSVPLGHAFGRIGCLKAGCCYGITLSHNHPLAIVYPEASLAAPPGIPLLALPILEAGALLLISLIEVLVYITTRAKGLCVAVYFALYAILRFSLEFFRDDSIRGIYGWFSTSQYISMLMFAISIVLTCIIVREHKQSKKLNYIDD
ncbi:MAG: prolipoprotein diacylglyceryl transferase [Oscillospiraceae bacterium]|nr:prolipoprotein diacylglyceryl transferase [Oscillospiraceae bacterium]